MVESEPGGHSCLWHHTKISTFMTEIEECCVLCEVCTEAAGIVDRQACRVKPPFNATLFTAICGGVLKFCITGKFCSESVMGAR